MPKQSRWQIGIASAVRLPRNDIFMLLGDPKGHGRFMDCINYPRNQKNSFSPKEVALIKSAQEDAAHGMGVSWREIKIGKWSLEEKNERLSYQYNSRRRI